MSKAKVSHNPPREDNYMRKIRLLWRLGAIPKTAGLHMLDVAHDDWCGVFEGQRCHCNPDVRLKYSLDGGQN